MTEHSPTSLTGITWRHTRGLLPLLATAQRFEETHPHLHIAWKARSLQAFADEPLETLVLHYDLLVIDHPSAGVAARGNLLLPLDQVLPETFLQHLAANSTGQSYPSYWYNNHLWALPIDAAAPVSLCRPDLLERAGRTPPTDWSQLLQLAREGLVLVPGLAIDSLMNFYMLCLALGEEPFTTEDRVVSASVAAQAMQLLRELLLACPARCLTANPIAIWSWLSESSREAYCPFAYGYSNYSRAGYASHPVLAGELVCLHETPLRSTLGGAGLAISANCSNIEAAAAYAQYAAHQQCQSTLYFDSGGQPGHRAAWLDPEVNRRSGNFFQSTLPVLDRAWVRPRFDGYLEFQHHAGEALHAYLRNGGSENAVLQQMNRYLIEARNPRGNGAQ